MSGLTEQARREAKATAEHLKAVRFGVAAVKQAAAPGTLRHGDDGRVLTYCVCLPGARWLQLLAIEDRRNSSY